MTFYIFKFNFVV